jgi:hypothetical protein
VATTRWVGLPHGGRGGAWRPQGAPARRDQLIDDINGQPAYESLTFGLDGVQYEIDLTAKNAAKLRDVTPWRRPSPAAPGSDEAVSPRRVADRAGAR